MQQSRFTHTVWGWAVAVLVGCAGAQAEPTTPESAAPGGATSGGATSGGASSERTTPEGETPTAPQSAAAEATTSQGGASPAERFHNEYAGFAITPPAGWRTVTAEEEQQGRQRSSTGNQDLDEGIRKHASPSLVVFWKYPEPYENLNPTIKVMLRPMGSLAGQSPRTVLSLILNGMKQALPSFEVIGAIEDEVVSGLPAAKVYTRHTLESTDPPATLDVRSRTWLVPRGNAFFLIAMSAPAEGEDASGTEFDRAFASIDIRR